MTEKIYKGKILRKTGTSVIYIFEPDGTRFKFRNTYLPGRFYSYEEAKEYLDGVIEDAV